MFALHISTDNAAFDDAYDPDDPFYRNVARAAEIARILRDIAGEVEFAADSSGLAFDINGNDVGGWVIS